MLVSLSLVCRVQGVFFNMYLLAYIISPRLCHSAVGYLEEEAVRTYTYASPLALSLVAPGAGHFWLGP